MKNDSGFFINGDVCLKEMRHKEYILERKRGDSYKVTARNDKRYAMVNSRQFQNIKFIVRHYDKDKHIIICDEMMLHLINLDPFWELCPEKKTRQYFLLESIKT